MYNIYEYVWMCHLQNKSLHTHINVTEVGNRKIEAR